MELTAQIVERELLDLRQRLTDAGAERCNDGTTDAVPPAQLAALHDLLSTQADVRAIALRAGSGELAKLREGVADFDRAVADQHAAVQAANIQLQVRGGRAAYC